MLIDKDITPYIIHQDSSLTEAFNKINANKSRIIFTVSDSGHLKGVLSDGDIRRWLIKQTEINLNIAVSEVHNTECRKSNFDGKYGEIEKIFTEGVEVLPLLDKQGRVVAVAKKSANYIQIGKHKVGKTFPTFIIAEIGNNHNGSLDLAKKLIDEAAKAGVDCAKFQMRDMKSLYRDNSKKNNNAEDLGSEYVTELLRKFQLSNDDLFRAFDYCREKGVMPLCTPWDLESVKVLDDYGMEGFKVASADLVNHQLLEGLISTHKPLICSTGMSREEEIRQTVDLLKNSGTQFALLHCNSTYPAPFKDVNLSYIKRLEKIGNCVVGYSGHERGINIAMAASAFGARIIEKHFTLDRNMEGNDHKVSLLPDELTDLVRGIKEIEESIGSDQERKITQGELMNREVLGKSLVINRDLDEGETITSEMIEVRSPGQGLAPYKIKNLIGKKAQRQFTEGDFFYDSDIGENIKVAPRSFSFKRDWGIPVRFHDVDKLITDTNPDLVEFHLSFKDLDLDYTKLISDSYNMDLVVHAPELFEGDHILDLASLDDEYRERSIKELQRVCDMTKSLRKHFKQATEKTLIIVNVGGATQDSTISNEDKIKRYKLIADSLSKLDQTDVEIIPQTMPPFPWHFGGQRYHNLFIDPDDIVSFCKEYGYRVCYDISHSKLACNQFRWSFKEFTQKVAPYSAHLHIVDAYGIDGEGVQIGEGEIDFAALGEWLNEYSPKASFIPEIWQGHKDNGSGFFFALDKLESWL